MRLQKLARGGTHRKWAVALKIVGAPVGVAVAAAGVVEPLVKIAYRHESARAQVPRGRIEPDDEPLSPTLGAAARVSTAALLVALLLSPPP